MYHSFFIHSSVHRHLGPFRVPAIVNSAAVNIGVPVSFSVLVFSGFLPSSRLGGSYGSFIPSFLRNLHAVFQYVFLLRTFAQCCVLAHVGLPALNPLCVTDHA